jgi:hypothetical protein
MSFLVEELGGWIGCTVIHWSVVDLIGIKENQRSLGRTDQRRSWSGTEKEDINRSVKLYLEKYYNWYRELVQTSTFFHNFCWI